MPKAGSGFMRAAGSAANSILSSRGGSWTVANLQGAREAVQKLYGNAYRSGGVFQYDSRGREVGPGRAFDSFADRAEKLARDISRDVRTIDREAQSQLREMQRWTKGIRASAAERREFEDTYRGEKLISGRGGRNAGDASEVARQMAGRGLISPSVAAMGNNVDIMNAINDAMNAVKRGIYSGVSSAAAQDFEADIFYGLMQGVKGVERGAMRRSRS